MEVLNLDTKEVYQVHERLEKDTVTLRLTKEFDKTDAKLRTCTYSKLTGFGHTINGQYSKAVDPLF